MKKTRNYAKAFLSLTATTVIALTSLSNLALADKPVEPTSKVVLSSEVKWDQLNPARGDQSPRAGTLWGDRNGTGPTGFLFNPVDGFQSPPHIHNVTYRGIVIRGLVHNDDPNADNMWMPQSSFWTQPKGKAHITSAKGQNTLAYIEIDEGPYLVHPTQEKFESQEVPINVDASNLVWTHPADLPSSAKGPQIAYLWGQPEPGKLNGTLLKIPAGFSAALRPQSSTFHAVVIQGQPKYLSPETREAQVLDPGSYFSSSLEADHTLINTSKGDLIVYVRTRGTCQLISSTQ